MITKQNIVSVLASLCVFSISLPADSRPGGVGLVTTSSRGVGRGGLAIDYSGAMKARNVPLTVEWEQSRKSLVILSGAARHSLPVEPWEMQDLLRIALDTGLKGLVEVSVDRVAGNDRHFYASPELKLQSGTSPLGVWLQTADLDFASVASMGPSTRDAELRTLAPGAHANRLLKEDADYRALSRDVVVTPIPWPMIVFHVGRLDQSQPVRWEAVFRPQFMTPDLQALEAEPNHEWIEPWMETQALRPYEPLKRAVASEKGRTMLRKHVPTVAAAEKYALAMAALNIYCSSHTRTCRVWQTNLPVQIAASPTPFTPNNQKKDTNLLTQGWDAARLAVAQRESNAEYRCWIFNDEAFYSLAVKPRYSEAQMIKILPEKRCSGTVAGVGVRILESALRLETELSSDKPRHAELKKAQTSLTSAVSAIENTPRLSSTAKALWKDRASHALIELARNDVIEKYPVVQNEVIRMLNRVGESCITDLQKSAKRARTAPTKRVAKSWRASLSRLERCRWYPADERVLTSASFHFAIGVQEARAKGREARMHSLDRLRMLKSHAAQATGKDAGTIRSMVTKLEKRTRR